LCRPRASSARRVTTHTSAGSKISPGSIGTWVEAGGSVYQVVGSAGLTLFGGDSETKGTLRTTGYTLLSQRTHYKSVYAS